MKHLTDDQIQAYLDGDKIENINKIEEHLQACEKCRLNLNAYEQIYTTIKIENVFPALSPNFALNTLKEVEKIKEKKWNMFENFLIAFTFIVSISLSVYFFNLTGFLSYFIQIDFSWFTVIVKKLTDTFSPNIIYLAAATLITGIIELFDRFKIQKFIK